MSDYWHLVCLLGFAILAINLHSDFPNSENCSGISDSEEDFQRSYLVPSGFYTVFGRLGRPKRFAAVIDPHRRNKRSPQVWTHRPRPPGYGTHGVTRPRPPPPPPRPKQVWTHRPRPPGYGTHGVTRPRPPPPPRPKQVWTHRPRPPGYGTHGVTRPRPPPPPPRPKQVWTHRPRPPGYGTHGVTRPRPPPPPPRPKHGGNYVDDELLDQTHIRRVDNGAWEDEYLNEV